MKDAAKKNAVKVVAVNFQFAFAVIKT